MGPDDMLLWGYMNTMPIAVIKTCYLCENEAVYPERYREQLLCAAHWDEFTHQPWGEDLHEDVYQQRPPWLFPLSLEDFFLMKFIESQQQAHAK
jgi:hypothetical protein